MPSTIRLLDEATINQIAAGEVIEGPVSVVKELIDNAIDAHADSISVELMGGGRQCIKVTDNGKGMGADDALLCFERHATSKLRSIDDLLKIATQGFRGEALSSIASIAKVQLKTRRKEDPSGTLIENHGGSIRSCSQVSCNPGTSFEVHDLFYNTPVRKRFLKSPSHDVAEIHKLLTAYALAYPELHFELIVDGVRALQTIQTLAQDFTVRLLERCRELLPKEISAELSPLYFEEGPYKFQGVIAWPAIHRPNRTGQYLFVNRRPVFSLPVSQAILDGYGTALPEKRFPLFALHLTLSGSDVDVNVHPQKKEVRFHGESALKEALRQAVSKALAAPAKNQETLDWILPAQQGNTPPIFNMPAQIHRREIIPEERFSAYTPQKIETHYTAAESCNETYSVNLEGLNIPAVIGTTSGYILLDRSPLSKTPAPGMCFMDQSRAEARLLYEQALGGLQNNGTVAQQGLITPLTLEFSQEQHERLSLQLDLLGKCGFTLRPFGKRSFIVDMLPVHIQPQMVQELLYSFLDECEESGGIRQTAAWQDEWNHKLAWSLARPLQKKGKRLDESAARKLLSELLRCQQPHFSPAGSPIFAEVSQADIAKLFRDPPK